MPSLSLYKIIFHTSFESFKFKIRTSLLNDIMFRIDCWVYDWSGPPPPNNIQHGNTHMWLSPLHCVHSDLTDWI